MEKLLRCRDLGLDCDFEACGETPEEVLKTAVDHARAIHGCRPNRFYASTFRLCSRHASSCFDKLSRTEKSYDFSSPPFA